MKLPPSVAVAMALLYCFAKYVLFRLDLAQNQLFRQFFESTGLPLPAYLLLV